MSLAAVAGSGSLAQGAGQLFSGFTQGQSDAYQGQVAALNAKLARQNANYAATAGSTQIDETELKGAAQTANVRTGLAANGLDVNTGSAASLQQSQRMLNNFDSAVTANKAAQQVRSYETTATNATAQEHLDEYAASTAEIGGALGATGSLLSGAPNLGALYSWMSGGGGGEGDLTDNEVDSMSAEDAATFFPG